MGMSYTTGDFYTNGTSGLGATANGKYVMPKVMPKPAPAKVPVIHKDPMPRNPKLEKRVMNGVGAMLTQGDFGAMGTMGFSVFGVDISKAATDLYQQQVSNLQKQATTAVQKAVTTFVNNVTGQKVTLTPAQQAQYEKDGTLPSSIAPEPPSFMDQYGKYIMIGGGVLAGLIAISLIVKMVRK